MIRRWREYHTSHLCLPNVILPLIMSGSLRISANAAIGMPQFATGPQKCVLIENKRTSNWLKTQYTQWFDAYIMSGNEPSSWRCMRSHTHIMQMNGSCCFCHIHSLFIITHLWLTSSNSRGILCFSDYWWTVGQVRRQLSEPVVPFFYSVCYVYCRVNCTDFSLLTNRTRCVKTTGRYFFFGKCQTGDNTAAAVAACVRT